jgi:hypothetical protein
MPHFDIPQSTHSRSNGNLFVWNTTDGPGTTTQYKFQIGTQPGWYDVYNGTWKAGGAPSQYTDNVTLPAGGSPTLYVRSLYVMSGRLYYTNCFAFTCTP